MKDMDPWIHGSAAGAAARAAAGAAAGAAASAATACTFSCPYYSALCNAQKKRLSFQRKAPERRSDFAQRREYDLFSLGGLLAS